jgi:xanthine dehydrogenase accessory factor
MLILVEKMAELIRRGDAFAVATVLQAHGSPGRIGHKMIVCRDGTTFGTVGGGATEEQVKADCLEALRRGEGLFKSYVLSSDKGLDAYCGGKQDMAIEIVPGRPHVLIVGGGHVGQAVGRLCRLLEYGFSVVDDRPEMASRDIWEGADSVFESDPGGFLREADLSGYSHILLLNYSPGHDLATLRASLERFDGPIGLIGSTRKRERLFKELPDHLQEKARGVRCPVGIPIPAQSPAEIAVTILAEIIADQHGGEDAVRAETRKRERRTKTQPLG